jgi:hypothetical protein
MDDIFIPLWPPAWVEDHSLSDEQLVAAGDEVKLMSAVAPMSAFCCRCRGRAVGGT